MNYCCDMKSHFDPELEEYINIYVKPSFSLGEFLASFKIRKVKYAFAYYLAGSFVMLILEMLNTFVNTYLIDSCYFNLPSTLLHGSPSLKASRIYLVLPSNKNL